MVSNPNPVTHRINDLALRLLDEHPEGIRWAALNRMIELADASFHPKHLI